MITAKCLHVFNFKRLDEQVFKSQQRQRIFNFKTQYKSSHEVGCFLETRVVGVAGGFLVWLSDLDLLGFDVVADLKLQLLDDGTEDLQPVLLQRRDSKTTKTFEIALRGSKLFHLTCSLALQSFARSSASASCDRRSASTMLFAFGWSPALLSSRRPCFAIYFQENFARREKYDLLL